MSDNFKNFHNGINLEPLSADPSNPKEGDLHVSDGAARSSGLWQYKSSTWAKVGTEGDTAPSSVYTDTLDYTATLSDDIILMNNTIAKTVTLPTAVGNVGKVFEIKKINNAIAGTVIIEGDGTELIDDELNISIGQVDDSIKIISNNVGWEVLKYPIVSSIYSTNANLSVVTSTTTNVVYEDLISDTHSAYNTSTGVYTIPIKGLYLINTQIAYDTDTGGVRILNVEINTINKKWKVIVAASDKTVVDVFYTKHFSKGDTIEITTWQNAGHNVTLSADNTLNELSIIRIK